MTEGVPGWMSPVHHELLNERQRLLDKKFASTLTLDGEYRLCVVRARLDQIDEARSREAFATAASDSPTTGLTFEQWCADLRAIASTEPRGWNL